jgi:hypothetical protein
MFINTKNVNSLALFYFKHIHLSNVVYYVVAVKLFKSNGFNKLKITIAVIIVYL